MTTPLLNAELISKSYGSKDLFSELSISIFTGDNIGLIGPNGSGKSSLMKILAGLDKPDSGRVILKSHLHIGYVPQTAKYQEDTPYDVLYNTLKAKTNLDEHEIHTAIAITLGKVGFQDPEVKLQTLSGGWKKRLDIANSLVLNPDILLLDEPTNHLDVAGIEWLGNFLKKSNITYLITSHDRVFLETITKRIIEIDSCYPQGIFIVEGSYSTFLERREEFLAGQLQYQRSLSSKVRREIEWLKQTPQARATKSRSRIQGAHNMISELSSVKTRNKTEQSDISFSETGRQTKKLLEAKNISKSFGNKSILENISITLAPKSRIAIVGENGSGKSTLMKIMAGEIPPDSGSIKYAENLLVVYFDQHREKLPENITVKEALSPNGDHVDFQGKSIHVSSWGKRFLFSSDRLELPISHLSGGEKARILIARLMTKPADVIFLDEPTNDLDIVTLEILEESLESFSGAIVFITHDRYMLNNLATQVLSVGNDNDEYLFADYSQWEAYQKKQSKPVASTKTVKKTTKSQEKQLSYTEKFELQNMEMKIVEIESQIEKKQVQLNAHTVSNEELNKLCKELEKDRVILEKLYDRWNELEQKKG